MKTKLIVSDLTWMSKPRICLGAITENFETVRPVTPYPGINESFLYLGNNKVIRPFSQITLDLRKHIQDPPHTEDWVFAPEIIEYRGELTEPQQHNLLKKLLDPSIEAIFGTQVEKSNNSSFVNYGTGSRSLGTIKVKAFNGFEVSNFLGSYEYHIHFQDLASVNYRMNITDLTFGYYINWLIRNCNNSIQKTKTMLDQIFNKTDIFLRVGLGRAWHPDNREPKNRCYLFVTGIYSFPDYLEGQCFVDFKT